MSWNEPGGGKNRNDKDPWSKGDAPPDLEELFKKLQIRFANKFGGARPGGGGNGAAPAIGVSWIILLLFAMYMISGVYIIQPAEKAVVTRFGKYLETYGAGPHWMPRFIDRREIVNVEAVHSTTQGGSMLTRDENIVNVEIAVQYRVENPKDYLFNLSRAEHSLKEVIRSALRNVVGHTDLDDVLTKGRALVASQIREQISQALDMYGAGLAIVEVAMQPATPPEAVKSAFDDVIRAREDEQRYINEADTYARGIWPRAEGRARRILEEAKAYQQEVVFNATGETARFRALLPEYQSAPQVTRDRLYLGAMSEVFSRTPKVFLDNEGGNLMMLPLDQMLAGKTPSLFGADNNATQPGQRSDQYQSSQSHNLTGRSLDRPGRGE